MLWSPEPRAQSPDRAQRFFTLLARPGRLPARLLGAQAVLVRKKLNNDRHRRVGKVTEQWEPFVLSQTLCVCDSLR